MSSMDAVKSPAGTAIAASVARTSSSEDDDGDEEDDSDIILYAPNVGLVSEQNANGRIDLVGHAKK